MELTSRLRSAKRPCEDQELFMAEVLRYTFPDADIQYESTILSTPFGDTQPDLRLKVPGSPVDVFVELTTSKLRHHDEKHNQRRVLRFWEQEHSDMRSVILYLQHMASPKHVYAALNHIKLLAEGICSAEIQQRMDNLASLTPPPTSIRWNRIYKGLTGQDYPHGEGGDIVWTPPTSSPPKSTERIPLLMEAVM
jgi:hypothetical protein